MAIALLKGASQRSEVQLRQPHGALCGSSKRPSIWSRDFAYPDEEPVVLSEYDPGLMVDSRTADVDCPECASLFCGRTVDICVGPQQRRWSVHKRLLDRHAPCFQHQFGDQGDLTNDVKSHENPILLPNEDPKGFELFVKWLYRGQLEDLSGMQTDEEKYEYAVTCHKLYLLCDKLGITELKNLAMDHYRQALFEARLVPDADEIKEMYFTSPKDSAIRKFLIKIAARQIMDPDVLRSAEDYRQCFEKDPDFAVFVINEIRLMSGGMLFDDPTDGDKNLWHDYAGGDSLKGDGDVEQENTTIRSRTQMQGSKERVPNGFVEPSTKEGSSDQRADEERHKGLCKSGGTPKSCRDGQVRQMINRLDRFHSTN